MIYLLIQTYNQWPWQKEQFSIYRWLPRMRSCSPDEAFTHGCVRERHPSRVCLLFERHTLSWRSRERIRFDQVLCGYDHRCAERSSWSYWIYHIDLEYYSKRCELRFERNHRYKYRGKLESVLDRRGASRLERNVRYRVLGLYRHDFTVFNLGSSWKGRLGCGVRRRRRWRWRVFRLIIII